MAWRYPDQYIREGEILNPDDWNKNHKEFAEEFNGYLDRDNFPQNSFTPDVTKNTAMNRVHSVVYTADDFQTTPLTVEWQSIDSAGQVLAELEIDCPVDCLLICDFGATWEDVNSPTGYGEIRLRIAVDGISIAETHFLTAAWQFHSAQIDGATPVAAGKHTVAVEAQVVNMDAQGLQQYVATEQEFLIGIRELVVRERRR